MDNLYLVWQSYKTNEYILIASLIHTGEYYVFTYFPTYEKAIEEGCVLPIHDESTDAYLTLPMFFKTRIISKDKNSLTPKEEFESLLKSLGRKNSDNFLIVDKKTLEELNIELPDNILKRTK